VRNPSGVYTAGQNNEFIAFGAVNKTLGEGKLSIFTLTLYFTEVFTKEKNSENASHIENG
jgi:hypothetical protein